MKNILGILIFLNTLVLVAQTKLPSFFGDNMVLQQDQEVSIWGKDTPNTQITIQASWGEDVKTNTDEKGEWRVKIKTLKADKKPYQLTINGSEEITLKNILFGEVWLCSGQSNMEMPVRGYPNSPVIGSNEAILNARNSNIRLFHTRYKASLTPVDDVDGQWTEATPKTVAYFSAVAYFFGKKLNEVIDVPIGLIHASWGGSSAEAWTDKETLNSEFPHIEIPLKARKAVMHTPSYLYNGMIAPYVGYNIKGAIWNQGETNRVRPEEYKKLLPAMIKSWRTKWNVGNFPFYMVQVPPFYYRDGEFSTFIVESQIEIMKTVENTGVATTTDIGACKDIHAPEKILIADRLAYWALAKNYGFEEIAYKGPIYKSMEVTDDNKIKVYFEESDRDRGLTNYGNKYDVKGFQIAGADQIFHPAKASINRNRIITVWSDEVPKPIAVRYAFENCIIGTLFSTAGIPAASFRTDNWDNVGRKNKP